MQLVLQRMPDGRRAPRGMVDPYVLAALAIMVGTIPAAVGAWWGLVPTRRWGRAAAVLGLVIGVDVLAATLGAALLGGDADPAITRTALAMCRALGGAAMAAVTQPVVTGHRALEGQDVDAHQLVVAAFVVQLAAPAALLPLGHPVLWLLSRVAG